MKMIRAIVRPDREDKVTQALEEAGFPSVTKCDVLGRGRQKGIRIADVLYDELAKTFLMVVVEDPDLDRAIEAINKGARTGHPGDGKIFVTHVERAITVRTGEPVL